MSSSALSACHSIADLRARAKQRLPRPIFDYVDGAAEDETTASGNTHSFERTRLVPRGLIDVSAISTATRVLGQDLKWPLICAPTGASRFYHADGERAVARAAAKAGVYYGLSTMSTHSLEDVAAAAPGPKFFQLYVFKDPGLSRALIARCKQAGYDALCLTIDAPVRGKREKELKSGMGVPMRLKPEGYAQFLARPQWLLSQALRGPMTMPNFAEASGARDLVRQTRFVGAQLDPSVSWARAAELIALWDGPFAIKGVMDGEDAQRAADIGASAVFVSNHGGRQLDGAPGAFEVLPAIAGALGDRMEIILDGGVRRGSHILKALARGAKACSIGRPYLYGLAAGGESGVARALTILTDELATAMKLCGCRDVAKAATDVRLI